MTLIEILTAISLFCAHDTDRITIRGRDGTDKRVDVCAQTAWKCIDKLRTPPKDPKKNKCMIFAPKREGGEYDHWINIPDCKLPNDPQAFERCFR